MENSLAKLELMSVHADLSPGSQWLITEVT